MTKLDKNGFRNEGSNQIAVGWEFLVVILRFPAMSTLLKSTSITLRILGLIHGVWGFWTTVFDLFGARISRMDSRVEESCSARSKALEAGFVWKREEKNSSLKLLMPLVL